MYECEVFFCTILIYIKNNHHQWTKTKEEMQSHKSTRPWWNLIKAYWMCLCVCFCCCVVLSEREREREYRWFERAFVPNNNRSAIKGTPRQSPECAGDWSKRISKSNTISKRNRGNGKRRMERERECECVWEEERTLLSILFRECLWTVPKCSCICTGIFVENHFEFSRLKTLLVTDL